MQFVNTVVSFAASSEDVVVININYSVCPFRDNAWISRLSYEIIVFPSVLLAKSFVPQIRTILSLSLYPSLIPRSLLILLIVAPRLTQEQVFLVLFLNLRPMPAPRELLIKVVLPCVLSPSSFVFVVVTALSVSTEVDGVVGLHDCGCFVFVGFFLGFLPFVVAECFIY